MKLHLLIFAFIFVFPFLSNAQDIKNAQAQQIGISQPELFDQLMVTVAGVGSNARDFLRHQNINAFMMPLRKVGFRGNDICYALAMCQEYYLNIDENYKVNLSPDFVFLSLEKSGKNITFSSGLRFLVENGTVSAAIMPYDASSIPPAVFATTKYKINNYLYIFRDISGKREKTYETKKAIMRGNPVMVELQSNTKVRNLTRDDQLSISGSTNAIHSFIVIAYDEDREAFQLLSVWGKQWGKNGHAWISYKDFGTHAVNGFVMVPEKY